MWHWLQQGLLVVLLAAGFWSCSASLPNGISWGFFVNKQTCCDSLKSVVVFQLGRLSGDSNSDYFYCYR